MEQNQFKGSLYAQHRINNYLLQKGFKLKIKTRYWIKEQQNGSFLTAQFQFSKRLTFFTVNFRLFLNCEGIDKKSPKTQHEQIDCVLENFIPATELNIKCTDNIELLDELIDAYLFKIDKEVLSIIEKYLDITFIKKHFPNREELYMLDWLPKEEQTIKECLDKIL